MDFFSIFYHFLHSQLMVTPPWPKESCAGKTVIVTGSNSGLGKEAVRHFVRLGAAKVIMGCRSIRKAEEAKLDIETTEKVKDRSIIEVWPLDMGSYDSVKEFARRAEGLNRIDIAILNAGISTRHFALFEENESTITVNVVSTFLLALLLLPVLRRSAEEFKIRPNLVITASDVHFFTSFPERKAPSIFDALNSPKEARMLDRYNVSKMIEVLVCRALAANEMKEAYPVTLNFLTPGLCYSGLVKETGFVGAVVSTLKFLFARTTEVGSRTLVHAALAGSETHGQYLADAKITKPSKLVLSEEGKVAQEKVWGELKVKLEKIQPGILQNF